MIYGSNSDSKNPLVDVYQVENGWIVTVHQANRDKEVSPETEAAKAREKEECSKRQLKEEKSRIRKELMTQLTSMAIMGEAASKAHLKSIDKKLESWKQDEEDAVDPEDFLKKMDSVIDEMAEARKPREFIWSNPANDYPKTETYIFADRQKMIAFVTEMLQPIIE